MKTAKEEEGIEEIPQLGQKGSRQSKEDMDRMPRVRENYEQRWTSKLAHKQREEWAKAANDIIEMMYQVHVVQSERARGLSKTGILMEETTGLAGEVDVTKRRAEYHKEPLGRDETLGARARRLRTGKGVPKNGIT